jgi:type IX secretion system PorP/SprF family membrane protein
MNMRLALTIAFCALLGGVWAQHSPLTSQYLFNGLVINPAYAGSRDKLTMNLTHRRQWVGLSGAPVTQILSIHAPVARRKVGLGLLVLNDRIGVSDRTGIFTAYSYRLRMSKGKLALGLGLGASLQRSRYSEVAIQDPNDQAFATDVRGRFLPNFSTGAFYYSKRWFAGLSLPFMLLRTSEQGNEASMLSQLELTAQPMATAGYVLDLSNDLKLKPTFLVRYRIESGLQADLSSNLIYRDRFWLGASYRTQDAFIASMEVLPTPQWRIGYAYDLGLSQLRSHHFGTHEVMLQYEFGYRIRVKDPRYF